MAGTVPFGELADEIESRIRDLCKEVDTELLWVEISSEQRIYLAKELSQLYFGEVHSQQISAIFRAVQLDQTRFKVRGLRIFPRSPAQVEQQLKSLLRREEKETQRKNAVNWMRQILEQQETVSVPANMEDLVRRIEDFLKRREGSQVQAWLSDTSPEQTPVEVAIEVLSLTGRLKQDAHHLLILAGIEEQFPQEVSKECARLKTYDSSANRSDYSDQYAFTIDDEDTRELDDALTFENRGEKLCVGIHIADVAHFVEKEDLLDREALRRSTSVYLPDRTVNMFPPRLSSDLASLNTGSVRPTMSFVVEFKKTGELAGWSVNRSQISVDRRLDYERVDQIIAGEIDDPLSKTLQQLSALAEGLISERQSRGALTIYRPELKILVEDERIDIRILDMASPSRRLVSEMMILANRLAAEFASGNNVPLIFRAQNPPESEISAPENYDPVALDKLFQKLEPSRLSVYPQPHSSLGLPCYTQLTSPIRRFTDLVRQRQLAAFLANDSLPYELQELMQILATVQTAENNVRALERKARRLFLLKYLNQMEKERIHVLVIKKQGSGYLIETTDLFIRGHLTSEKEIEPGQVLEAVIERIDPEKGIFRLQSG
jgi:exoribonuclease-2